MTLPDERTRAIYYAKEFLYDLLDPKKTKGVPKDIRRRAALVLRHFPAAYEIAKLYKVLPDTFGEYEYEETNNKPLAKSRVK